MSGYVKIKVSKKQTDNPELESAKYWGQTIFVPLKNIHDQNGVVIHEVKHIELNLLPKPFAN